MKKTLSQANYDGKKHQQGSFQLSTEKPEKMVFIRLAKHTQRQRIYKKNQSIQTKQLRATGAKRGKTCARDWFCFR